MSTKTGQLHDAAQSALSKGEALLNAIRVIGLAEPPPKVEVSERDRAATVIALWYMLRDLVGDEDEPLRWAERDAARRAGAS